MLFLANEDYKLKCYDSTKVEVSLEGLSPACFTVIKYDSSSTPKTVTLLGHLEVSG